jgi:hypothetical protein
MLEGAGAKRRRRWPGDGLRRSRIHPIHRRLNRRRDKRKQKPRLTTLLLLEYERWSDLAAGSLCTATPVPGGLMR